MAEPRPLISFETETNLAKAHDHGYYGYEPVCAADFPFEEDGNTRMKTEDKTVDRNLLRDNAKISKTLLVFSIVFCIGLIAMLIWQILIAKCRVTSLCETVDRSSIPETSYLFQNFNFRVPSALVWIGLTAGTLGLLAATVLAVFVVRKTVGTPRMVEIATVIRKGSTTFLANQNLAIVGPVLLLFVLVGVGLNWETAGCYAFGAVLCKTTSLSGMSIATRGNVRTTAAARIGIKEAMKVAFRTGGVAGLSILSTALLGLSAVYLMFSDVRALAGFAAGASTTALFMRVSGGIFHKATNKSAALLQSGTSQAARSDPQSTASVATYVGSGVSSVLGLGPDLFESFVGAVIATAILGSNLPFFYRDSFATCVFNHLEIDQNCGPFGYPEGLSYAVYICRNNNFYLAYPSLTTWASNTAFVAVPFVIGAAGLLVSFVCVLYVRVATPDAVSKGDNYTAVRKLKFNMRVNTLVGSVLLLASSAAVCFGLFGPNSDFQNQLGFGNRNNLLRMELDPEFPSKCKSTSLNVTDTSASQPFPVPQGGVYVRERYRPISNAGLHIGPAGTTDRRLFGCAALGIGLGVLMTGLCSVYFTSESHGPTQRVANAAQYGVSAAVLQGLGNGLMATVPPTTFLFVGVLSANALYGAYGVGVMAVSFLSGFGIVATGSVLGAVADNAKGIARMARVTRRARRTTAVLDSVGGAGSAAAAEYANAAAFLAAVALILAGIQTSGLTPSPRELVGSPELPPKRLLESSAGVPLWDLYVLAGILIGVAVPFVASGLLLLAVRRAARAMVVETKRQESGDAGRYGRFIGGVTRASLIESVPPVVIIFATPLVVGFGFGQRALLGMLVSVIGTGFVFGTFVSSAAGSWMAAERFVAADEGDNGRGSKRHWSMLYARELGLPLRECVAPGMQCLVKTSASVSIVAITLMQRDNSRGWIGGVLLSVLGLLLLIFALWKTVRNRRIAAEAKKDSGRSVKAPPKRVSPFFVGGVTVDPLAAVPGSQMADALDTLGNPRMPVEAGLLPGLSDRAEADFGNLDHLRSPRAVVARDGFVLPDEARG